MEEARVDLLGEQRGTGKTRPNRDEETAADNFFDSVRSERALSTMMKLGLKSNVFLCVV